MENTLDKRYGLITAITMVVGIVIGSGVFFKAEKILTVVYDISLELAFAKATENLRIACSVEHVIKLVSERQWFACHIEHTHFIGFEIAERC